MASGKRQPSKQKRTQQNRQQRSALEARKAAASTPAPSSGASSSRGGGSGGLLGRLRGAVGPAPARSTGGSAGSGASSGAKATGGGGAARRPAPARTSDQPVGYRAAMIALIAAAAAVAVSFIWSTPVTADGDPYSSERVVAEWADSALQAAQTTDAAQPDEVVDEVAKGEWMPQRDSEKVAIAAFPASLAMIFPLVAAYYAFRAVQRGRGSRVVNRAMYATLFGAVLTFGLLTLFLPTVIAVGVAGFQVRKAETAEAMAAAGDGSGTDDDVIEAEVVEDDVVDAEVVDDEDRDGS